MTAYIFLLKDKFGKTFPIGPSQARVQLLITKKADPEGPPLALRLGARLFYSQESSTWVRTASLTDWILR